MVKGGLGIRRMVDFNNSFLMKLGYLIFFFSISGSFVWVLRDRYKWIGMVRISIAKSGCSPLWRGISRVWDEVKQGLCWNLGKAKRWIFSLIGGFRMAILSLMMFGQGRWPWLALHPSYP